ncbi:MAG: NifU family protein [Actinomycetota bacterium]|nr:NifU family protein [Actinomycetota bacterium]
MAAPNRPAAGLDSQPVPGGPAHDSDDDPIDLRSVGDRIETLLVASSSNGAVARERTEELVRLLSELYGKGLERMMDLLYDNGALTQEVLAALADDDLIASLLLVHGLHPEDVATRVERALDSVRPYLKTHGGDVELLGLSDEGVVQLKLLGSCDGCSSSAATMSLAVEDAVTKAAPEVTGFDVQSPAAGTSAPAGRGLLPLAVVPHRSTDGPAHGDQSSAASAAAEGVVWHTIPDLPELANGEVTGQTVGTVSIIVCRNGDDLLAFLDSCAACGDSLKSARLERRLGGTAGGAVLTCPSCRAHFDVRGAGASIDVDGMHLSPLPLLTRSGRTALALPHPDLLASPDREAAGMSSGQPTGSR